MTSKYFLVLLAILALAASFRLTGLNWDSNGHLHPDERFLTMVATSIVIPQNPALYFDTAHSPANPHNKGFSFYVYGTYPLHLAKLVAAAVKQDTYDGITLVGRILSAYADLLTALTVFLIASFLMKRPQAGLFAAFAYAISILPIQLSHYFTVDPFVTLFITLAIWQLVRGKRGVLVGIATGLAVSAKISSILILPVIGVSFLAAWPWKKSRGYHDTRRRLLMDAVLFAVSLLVTVRIAYPYLFNGVTPNKAVIANWKQLASFNEPTTSFPPGLQWIGVSPAQPAWDAIVWGLGLPLGLVTGAACVYIFRDLVLRKRWGPVFYLVFWIVLLVAYQSLQFTKPMRYFWAVYPALAVLCGIIIDRAYRRFGRLPYARVGIMAGLTLLAVWPVSYMSVYRTTHTRVAASIWVYTHIPADSTIAWEHWDDPVPFALGALTPVGYKQPQLPVYDPEAHDKWQKLSDTLSTSDYVVLSSNRGYGAIARARKRFPQTVLYYRRLFDGSLGFEPAAQFLSRPNIPVPGMRFCVSVPGFSYGALSGSDRLCPNTGISLIDDYSDETFTVYDHPQVTILKNTGRLSREELYRRITEPPERIAVQQ